MRYVHNHAIYIHTCMIVRAWQYGPDRNDATRELLSVRRK